MKKLIEILKEWGFQEGRKGHYFKFVTLDSCVSFDITEDTATLNFKALCGADNEKLTKSWKIMEIPRLDAEKSTIKSIIKGYILNLIIDVHKEYLFYESRN